LLVSEVALRSMAQTVGPKATRAFVERFVALWPVRCERLKNSAAKGDCEAFCDAALSLKSGAAMAGAVGLAALGEHLHEIARDPHRDDAWDRAREAVADLEPLGTRSVAELSAVAASVCGYAPARNFRR
jgi:hypothetical protein